MIFLSRLRSISPPKHSPDLKATSQYVAEYQTDHFSVAHPPPMGYSLNDEEYKAYELLLKKMSDGELLREFADKSHARNEFNTKDHSYYFLARHEINDRKLLAEKSTPKSKKQLTRDAVTWCVRKYREDKKKNEAIVARGIAREAVEKFFPYLRSNGRTKMIDNLRNSFLKKVKSQRRGTK
ncbi:MAG: hypothetical protein ACKVRP_08110 [Bacteroidota bacterium]